MAYAEFAADMTLCRSFRFHSVEETEEAVKALGVSSFELRQLGRGSFRSDLAAIQTSEGIALSQRFERNFFSPLCSADGMVSLLMTSTAGGDLISSGDVISNEKLLVQTPEAQVDLTAPDFTRSDALAVPESRFYKLLETICPGGRSIRPGQLVAVEGDTHQLNRLRHAIFDLVKHPELDPQHERQANLISEVIAWMGDSDSQWRPEGFSVNSARMRMARRARDYMEDHFPDPIRLEDICQELGVGLRTMQRAFAEYFQISPYDYLKKLRLDRARRALISGSLQTHSVTDLALSHGFHHLGRFSNYYREAFGELPRETLARS